MGGTEKLSHSLRKGAETLSIDPPTASGEPKTLTRIWNIGELGGGVSYFGEDNLLGIYSLLKDRISQNTAPNLIVFRQILPEVPKYGTKSYRARNLLIADEVDDLDQATVMMKPHLSRITDLIKKSEADTKVVYVWGYNDDQNEKAEYEALGEAFNHNPNHLARMRMTYNQVVADIGSKIDNIDIELAHIKDEIKNVAKKQDHAGKRNNKAEKDLSILSLKLPAKMSYLEKKREQLMDELSDNLQIKDLYTKLIEMWIGGRNAEEVFEALGEEYMDLELINLIKPNEGHTIEELRKITENEFNSVKRQISTLKEKSSEKGSKLEMRAKELANKLTKFSHMMIANERSKAERATEERLSRERRFTGLEAGTPSQTRIESRLSRLIIESSIKDVFGRRMHISITSGNRTYIQIGDLKVVAGTKGDNTSPHFIKDSSYKVRQMLRTLENDADVILLSGSPRGMDEPLPKCNRGSEIFFTDVAPPCINVQKLMQEHANGRKTWFTEMLTKGMPASGFNEIEICEGRATNTFISSEKLAIFAAREKRAQARVLAKMIAESYSYNSSKEELDARDMLQLRNKLPSEITEKNKFAKLLDNLGTDRNDKKKLLKISSKIFNQDFKRAGDAEGLMSWAESKLSSNSGREEFNRILFVDITDTHFGSPGEGYPNRIVFDRMIKWILDNVKEKVVLVLDGDNIEGNLGSFKNRVNKENDLNNESAFGDYLVKNGIGKHSREYEESMRDYREWLYYKSPIQSLNTQADLFVEAIKPLVKSNIVTSVIVTDGNHANGTFPGGDVTESGELAQRIVGIAPDALKDKIRRVYGGRHGGYGEFEIGSGLGISVGHRTEANTIERLMPRATVAVGGDRHRHRKTIMGGRAILEGIALQGNTGHPDVIGIATTDSLRGVSIFTLEYENSGKLLSAADTFVSVDFLKRKGYLKINPLISGFEAAQHKINVLPKKMVAY
jgi:hypothetical protein